MSNFLNTLPNSSVFSKQHDNTHPQPNQPLPSHFLHRFSSLPQSSLPNFPPVFSAQPRRLPVVFGWSEEDQRLAAMAAGSHNLVASSSSSSTASTSSQQPLPQYLNISMAPSSGESVFYRSPLPASRLRTNQACEKCRARKTKCSGNRPNCQRCKDRGLKCEYTPENRVRGPTRPRPVSDDISRWRSDTRSPASSTGLPRRPASAEQHFVHSIAQPTAHTSSFFAHNPPQSAYDFSAAPSPTNVTTTGSSSSSDISAMVTPTALPTTYESSLGLSAVPAPMTCATIDFASFTDYPPMSAPPSFTGYDLAMDYRTDDDVANSPSPPSATTDSRRFSISSTSDYSSYPPSVFNSGELQVMDLYLGGGESSGRSSFSLPGPAPDGAGAGAGSFSLSGEGQGESDNAGVSLFTPSTSTENNNGFLSASAGPGIVFTEKDSADALSSLTHPGHGIASGTAPSMEHEYFDYGNVQHVGLEGFEAAMARVAQYEQQQHQRQQ